VRWFGLFCLLLALLLLSLFAVFVFESDERVVMVSGLFCFLGLIKRV
jgi:hypothetical protein